MRALHAASDSSDLRWICGGGLRRQTNNTSDREGGREIDARCEGDKEPRIWYRQTGRKRKKLSSAEPPRLKIIWWRGRQSKKDEVAHARERESNSLGLSMMASSSRSSKLSNLGPSPLGIGPGRTRSTGVGSESSELRLVVVSLDTALEGPAESRDGAADAGPFAAAGISRWGAGGRGSSGRTAAASPPFAPPL